MSEQETEMDKLTTKLAEFVCDEICKYPVMVHSEESLEEICSECELGKYICDILNTYNKLNDFEKTQSFKLLQKVAELEAKCQLETKNSD